MNKLAAAMLACVFLFAVPAGLVAQLNTVPKAQMSRGQLKKLEREAKTPSQLRTLAAYYRQKEQKLRARAAEEKIEWERRSQNVTGPNAKPSRPVDSARSFYEYYQYESDHAAKLAEQYEENARELLQ